MKLELTIPSAPGFLYMLPGLDLIVLVMIFPFLGASFVRQSGMEVTLHESPWRYQQMDNPVVVTLGAGKGKSMWINKKQVAMKDLEEIIQKLQKSEGGEDITTAVVRSDVGVPSGVEKDVINRILMMGLKCVLVGKPTNKK